ncbi:MAG: outer membrane beta-barrel protein [Saprospirales bacterium]|nr:outer membrane beta-barrel protein [Saprospirales bacterium]
MGINFLARVARLFLLGMLLQGLSAPHAKAQFLEVGANLGLSNYRGDLSNNSVSLYLKETKGSFGIFASYHLNDLLAVRLGAQYAGISGSDANAPGEEIRSRNLSFRSILLEGSLVGEFYVPGFQPYNLSKPVSPYIFAGIAGAYFNPKTEFAGETVSLQPLGTEGQGMPGFGAPYSRVAFSIPFGLGVKFAVTDLFNVGLELGLRRSFSDYLDDVSGTYVSYEQLLAGNGPLAAALGNRTGEYQGKDPVSVATGTRRGDQAKGDWYYIMGITLSWNFLDNGLVGGRKRSTRRQGCKTY